jgi:L-serine dehydratase
MRDCIAHGLVTDGQLPGGLNVKRRAANLWKQANVQRHNRANDLPHDALHQVSLYAMAVNEENAAGGRVVTAPTNGAAGIIRRCCATTPKTASRATRSRACAISC